MGGLGAGSLVADGTGAYAGIVVHCTLALGCLHGMGSSRWACGAFLPDRGAYQSTTWLFQGYGNLASKAMLKEAWLMPLLLGDAMTLLASGPPIVVSL